MHTLSTWCISWTRGFGFWMGRFWIPSVLSHPLLEGDTDQLCPKPFPLSSWTRLLWASRNWTAMWLSFGQWNMSGRVACYLQAWHTTFHVLFFIPFLFWFDADDWGDLGNHTLNMAESGGGRSQVPWITTWRRATCHSGVGLYEWEINVSWLKSLRFRGSYVIVVSIALTNTLLCDLELVT